MTIDRINLSRRPAAGLRRRGRVVPFAIAGAVLSLFLPALTWAHAVVFPKSSAPGAYEKYVLRVPNEKNVPTTRVELRFPDDVRVVSFGDVTGWELQVLADSAGRVTGAVWTGTLPPRRFVEFPFVAVNPTTSARLVWPAFQTYADGERVEWTGPEDAKAPASTTEIADTPSVAADSPAALYLASAALMLALVSLGLVLRRPASERG
jgi:uncharacterized protein YcnI